MRFNKLNIVGFGKLSNISLDVNDDFNEFIKNNGEGKSTIFNFICAMFYGVGKNSIKDLRGLYLPWDGSNAAGNIEFSSNGEYRLERVFGKSQKDDISKLIDLTTGSEINNITDYGQHFFGMDLESFKSTLFINNKDLIIKASTSLHSILVNTLTTGDEIISIDYAKTRLNDFNKVVNENNRFSTAYEIVKKKIDVEEEISKLSADNNKSIEKINENNQIQDQLDKINQTLQHFEEISQYRRDKAKYQLYLFNIEYNDMKSKKLFNDDIDYDKCINELISVSSLHTRKMNYSILIISLIIFMGFTCFGFIDNKFFLGSVIFGVYLIFSIIYVVKRKKDILIYNENLEKQKKSLYEKYYSTNLEDALKYIKGKKEQSHRVDLSMYENVLKDIDTDELEKYKDFEENHDYDITIDLSERDKLLEQRDQLSGQIQRNIGSLDSINISQRLAELNNYKKTYEDKLNQYKLLNKSLIIASELIDEAKTEIFSDFTPNLKAELSRILNELTNGKFKEIIINANFDILLDEGSNTHQIDYYSQGYKDIVYIALRIAFIKMVKDNSLPIFLDDPFVNLDKENKKIVKKYFNNLSKTNQIFYFSCSK